MTHRVVIDDGEKRYQLMVKSVTDYAMFLMDTEGYVTTWNLGGEFIFGYKEEEIIGKPFATIFTEEERTAGIPKMELDNARKTGQTRHEGWRVRRDGSRFWGSGVVTSIWEDEHLQGYVKILRDNTQRKQMEQDLRDLNETLEQRVQLRTKTLQESEQKLRELAIRLTEVEQEERERIAQLLHDDLQQHLYAVQMQLALFGKAHTDSITQGMQDNIAQINNLLRDAIQMVHDLSYELSPPDLHKDGLITSLQWLADHMKTKHGLMVALNPAIPVDNSHPIPEEEVSALLFRIVRELLFNVIKHAGVNEATITLTQDKNSIQVQVADKGDGFDVDQLFHQKRAGYGITTMRRRLDLIGGRMTVESTPHKGTTTTLVVPFKPQSH